MIAGALSTIFMGITLGLLGAGGSILTVPILVFILGVVPSEATAYSLFIVGVTALMAATSYYKKKLIRFKIGFIFALPAFVGVYSVRLLVMPRLPQEIASFFGWVLTKDALILIVFAVIMILAAYAMIRPSKVAAGGDNKSLNLPLIALEGLLVGGVTGFVGAGGGFLIIPALVILAGLEMKEAVGTSLMIISIKSLFGFIGDVQGAMVIDWTLILSMSALSVLGAIVGGLLSSKINPAKLKPLFGYFVMIAGVSILVKEVVGSI